MRGGVLMPRDYHKAYEQIKDKKKLIGVQVYTQTAEDFKAKCYLNETHQTLSSRLALMLTLTIHLLMKMANLI